MQVTKLNIGTRGKASNTGRLSSSSRKSGLEDSNNLTILNDVAAKATRDASSEALLNTKERILVKDGSLVKYTGNQKEVLKKMNPHHRKVGTIINLSHS